jgi:hypothetical protein
LLKNKLFFPTHFSTGLFHGSGVCAQTTKGRRNAAIECDKIGLPIYFEKTVSIGAGDPAVGFVSDTLTLHSLQPNDAALC